MLQMLAWTVRYCAALFVLFAINLSAGSQTIGPSSPPLNCSRAVSEATLSECENLALRGHKLNVDGRYAPLMQRIVAKPPENSVAWDDEVYSITINIFEALNNCSTGDKWFSDCIAAMDATYEACTAVGNYTTWAYGVCGAGLFSVQSMVLTGEIAIFHALSPADEIETLTRAQKAWNEFVDVECKRIFEKYKGGSIAPLEEVACFNAQYESRILVINGENRFQGRDMAAEDPHIIRRILMSMAL